MSPGSGWFHWQGNRLLLHLYVQPKSSRDEFVGPHGTDSYKVKITAPPADGKANKHLCRFLAKAFGVPISQVNIITGEKSRIKRLSIEKPLKFPLPIPKTSQ